MRISILIFILFQLFPKRNFAQDYFFTNYNEAKAVAISNGKRLLVDFSATWCQPCKYMEQEVFPTPKVKNFLKKDYVCVKLHKKDHKNIFQQYNIEHFPTYIIFDSSNREIHRWSGSSSPDLFLQNITRFDEQQDLEKSISAQNNDLSILYKYYDSLMKSNDIQKASNVAHQILSQSKDWSAIKNMNIIVEQLTTPQYKKYYLNHTTDFSNKLDTKMYYPKILAYYFGQNYEKYKDLNTIPIEQIKHEFIQLYGTSHYLNFYHHFLISVLGNKANYQDLYQATFIDLVNHKPYLFKSPFVYDDLGKLIVQIKKKKDLSHLYQGFLYQMNFDDVVVNYYDLKALLEYRLGKKLALQKTKSKMEQISKKEYGGAFESELDYWIGKMD